MCTKEYNDTNKYSSKNNGKHTGCKLGFGWGAQRERLKSFLTTSSGKRSGGTGCERRNKGQDKGYLVLTVNITDVDAGF